MNNPKQRRVARIRSKINGIEKRPRLAAFRSLNHINAQLIDDVNGVTLVSATDLEIKDSKLTPTKKAEEVGKLIAKKATEKKIAEAIFDRHGYKYHGRIKALVEGARAGGLKI